MSTDAQRRARTRGPVRRSLGEGGFTLAEMLAALLFMAILIPVAMHGVSVASRAGMLGQRKAAAMRVAECVIDELIVSGQLATAAPYGNVVAGDTNYPWTMRTEPWTEDAMTVVTVNVSFDVQGNTYQVSASTLYDPAAVTTTTPGTTATPATQ